MNETTKVIDAKQFEAALNSVVENATLKGVRAEVRAIAAVPAFMEFLAARCLETSEFLESGSSPVNIGTVVGSNFHLGFATGRAYAEIQRLEEMVK